MNINRAKEITQSGEMVEVQYQGEAIYIQSVNEDNGTARIYPLQNRQAEKDVPITNLTE